MPRNLETPIASASSPAIFVSEWLTHRVIRRYLMLFSDEAWPDVIKWTFLMGLLTLQRSRVAIHQLAVEDLIELVKANSETSLSPAQRLAPLQFAPARLRLAAAEETPRTR
eukprot:GHVT01069884.1.p1 GENE.GHVT01069884.1~~GHVT01069884.1.p1  ORF type:complete len:129 (+),score=28.16 GHVT01069884.1:55-387(+)